MYKSLGFFYAKIKVIIETNIVIIKKRYIRLKNFVT